MKKLNNFRDLQEAVKNNHLKIKKNKIFRSGHPDNLKDRDLRLIMVKTIIDLRAENERKKSKVFNRIDTINTPIYYNNKIREKVLPIIYKKNVKDKVFGIIYNEYINFVEKEKNVVKEIFDLLENKDNYPVLIHCRAGKDRTGFIVAIILLSLEADSDMIINDYLESNKYILNRAKRLFKLLKIFTFGLFYTDNIELVLASHPHNIKVVIDIINDKYGGIVNYLKDCGIKTEVINNIKKNLLD
ncbi:MAG: tyrosine-protein phosphatase [Spirochaetes bacterium]|nr:tyrosine-protein phosphatase [Spirochaetota bacterium]